MNSQGLRWWMPGTAGWLWLIVFCWVSSAYGSSSRILSLGGAGDYFADSFHATRWYGCLPEYPNLAILELGQWVSTDDGAAEPGSLQRRGAGVHFRLDAGQRWGSAAVYLSEVVEAGQVPGSFLALWARSFGPVQVGFFSNWTFRESERYAEFAGDQVRQLAEDLTLGIGLRSDLGERLYCDLAADITGSRREFGYAPPREYSISGTSRKSFDLRIRFFAGLGDRAALIPLCQYTRVDRLADGDEFALAVLRDHYETRVGLGLNLFPDADNLLVASYEVQFGQDNRNAVPGTVGPFGGQRISYTVQELRLGVESRLLSWLSLRGGCMQHIPEREVTTNSDFLAPGNETVKDRSLDLNLNLGLGIFFGSFTTDLVFSDETPYTFGHFLTGAGGARETNFSSITMSYRF